MVWSAFPNVGFWPWHIRARMHVCFLSDCECLYLYIDTHMSIWYHIVINVNIHIYLYTYTHVFVSVYTPTIIYMCVWVWAGMCIIAHVHVHLRADQTNTYIPICMRRSVHLEPWKKQPQFSNHHILFTDSGSSTARRPPQSCRNLGCTCDAKPAHFFVIGGFLVDGSLSLSVSLFPLFKCLSTASGGRALAFIETSLHVWMYLWTSGCQVLDHLSRNFSQNFANANVQGAGHMLPRSLRSAFESVLYSVTLYVPYHNIHKATRRTRSIGLAKGLALAEPRSRFGSACRHQAKALLPSHIETLSLTLECIEWGKKLLHG